MTFKKNLIIAAICAGIALGIGSNAYGKNVQGKSDNKAKAEAVKKENIKIDKLENFLEEADNYFYSSIINNKEGDFEKCVSMLNAKIKELDEKDKTSEYRFIVRYQLADYYSVKGFRAGDGGETEKMVGFYEKAATIAAEVVYIEPTDKYSMDIITESLDKIGEYDKDKKKLLKKQVESIILGF